MPAIDLHHVWVDYPLFGTWNRSVTRGFRSGGAPDPKGVMALKDVSLSLGAGERLAVLGHNGAGKTTLIRVLAGLLPPSRGKAGIQGRPSATLSLGCEGYPEATVQETIVLRGILAGFSGRDIQALTREIIAYGDLDEIVDQPLASLSSGVMFRMGLGCALFFQTDILFFDEVMDTVDPDFVRRAKSDIVARTEQGAILVVVERSLAILEGLCSRAVILEKGHLSDDGDFDHVLARHSRRYVL